MFCFTADSHCSGFCSEIQISQVLDNLVRLGDAAAVTQQLSLGCLCSMQGADSRIVWEVVLLPGTCIFYLGVTGYSENIFYVCY